MVEAEIGGTSFTLPYAGHDLALCMPDPSDTRSSSGGTQLEMTMSVQAGQMHIVVGLAARRASSWLRLHRLGYLSLTRRRLR